MALWLVLLLLLLSWAVDIIDGGSSSDPSLKSFTAEFHSFPLHSNPIQSILFTPETSGPITNTTDRIITQATWTRVLPADQFAQSASLHFRAAYKLFALQRVREVALVQALNVSVAVENHFHLSGHINNNNNRAISDLYYL